MNSNVSVIIPIYNEELNIEYVIEGVEKYCQNIIVVDDKSTDNSYEIIKSKSQEICFEILYLHNLCLGN